MHMHGSGSRTEPAAGFADGDPVARTSRVVVAFEGDGSGVEEMSWGQREIWTSMVRCESAKPVGGVKPLPPETTVEDIAEELRYLMSRYQVMRTRLRWNPGSWPQQVVSGAGEIALEIVEAGDTDPGEIAAAVCERYRRTPYDYAVDWPVRMAVIRHHGVLTHMAVIICHLAMDGFSGLVMMREVAARTATPVVGMQPLEQARWQRTPAGRRLNEAAMRYWESVLATMPTPWLGESSDRREPRRWEGLFDSPALLLAVRLIAARSRGNAASVLLAAFSVALARVTGINPVVIRPMASNRFRAGLAEVVAPVCQAGVCVVDVEDVSFEEAIGRVQRATMTAYKYAYADPARVQRLVAETVARRGPAFDLDCFFNDRRIATRVDPAEVVPAPQEVGEALPRSAFRWIEASNAPGSRLYVQVDDVPDTVRLNIFADTHHLSPADAEALMWGTQAVAVEAALGGMVSMHA